MATSFTLLTNAFHRRFYLCILSLISIFLYVYEAYVWLVYVFVAVAKEHMCYVMMWYITLALLSRDVIM